MVSIKTITEIYYFFFFFILCLQNFAHRAYFNLDQLHIHNIHMCLLAIIVDRAAVEGSGQPILLSMKRTIGFGAGSMHDILLSPFIVQIKKLRFGNVELPNITRILRVEAQSLSSDFQSLFINSSSFFCSMLLCPLQYILMLLGGRCQLNIETGALRKSDPLEKAWRDLDKTLGAR